MTTILKLLEKKGREVLSVGPENTVYDAIKKMADHNVGSLVVLEEGKLIGIITERHYARNVFLKGRSSPQTTVGEVMSRRVTCAWPEQTVKECMAIMTDKAVRHLPVLDKKQLIGVISIGDLVENIISDQEFIIEQLEHYISS